MSIDKILSEYDDFSPVIEDQANAKYHSFDFTVDNEELKGLDMNNQIQFEAYIEKKIQESNSDFGIGRYAENRVLYKRFNLFEQGDPRSFHLGIDIWKEAGTPIFSPLEGVIHSFKDNNTIGDYGPTIILTHTIEGLEFHTLYGHLSKDSLNYKKVGDIIKKGQAFCRLGDWQVNVNWPPHLHFQIIKNMRGMEGDFPGVCEVKDKLFWMENCPDPNLILNIPGL